MNKQDKLIKELYNGLKQYYDYVGNLEDAIYDSGDHVAELVFEKMPDLSDDEFNHKHCRFLLSDVEEYFKEE